MKTLKTIKQTIKTAKIIYDWAQKILQLETRETFSVWSKLVETVCAPNGFYSLVEINMKERQIPGVTISRTTAFERSFISPRRKYLRIQYDFLNYDICAAPYGATGFFISTRLYRVNILALFAKYLFIAFLIAITGMILELMFAWRGTIVTLLIFFSAVHSLKREASGASFNGALDELFSKMPVVRIIYQNLIKPDTLYREDLKATFQHAVQNAVMQSIDESASPRGYTRHSSNNHQPNWMDLHEN